MKKAVIYIHGKGGNPSEANHYERFFADCDVLGFDYCAETPWEAKNEFPTYFDGISKKYDAVILIANSIGAFLAMSALENTPIEKAYFISPVVDMQKLITDMMIKANITQDELRVKKNIETTFGETLSWEYLCYVRKNPIRWECPTCILYGEKDHLMSLETISSFAEKTGATLDVMAGGEHWFHTPAQMAFLDEWLEKR